MDQKRLQVFHEAGEELAESLEFLHAKISNDASGQPLCIEGIEMETLISAFMKKAYENKLLGSLPGMAIAVLREVHDTSVCLAEMGGSIPQDIEYATTKVLQ